MQKVASKTIKFLVFAFILATAIAAYAWNKWSDACVSDRIKIVDPFETARWISGDVETRTKMLGALLASQSLVLTSRANLLSALGKPDSESTEQIGYVVATYSDGRTCGLHRHAVLKINFDANGKTKSAVLTQD
jgi:hypothetical protein